MPVSTIPIGNHPPAFATNLHSRVSDMSNYGMDPSAYGLLNRRRSYQTYAQQQQQHHQPQQHQQHQPQPQPQHHSQQQHQPNHYNVQPLSFDLSHPIHNESIRYSNSQNPNNNPHTHHASSHNNSHASTPTTNYQSQNGLGAYSSYAMQTSQPLTPISATTSLQYGEPSRFDHSYYPQLMHHAVLPRPATSLHQIPISAPPPLYNPQPTLPPQSLTVQTQNVAVTTPAPQSPKIPEVEPCTKNYGANIKDPDLSVWGDPCESAPPLQPGGKRRVYCWYCDKIFDDRKWVQRHAENHFYPAWECNLCHNRAHRPDVLERHCKVTCLKSHNRQGEDPKDHVKKTSPLARERAESWRKQHGKEPLRASKKARVTGPCDSPAPLFATAPALSTNLAANTLASTNGSGATTPSIVSMNSSRSNSLQGP